MEKKPAILVIDDNPSILQSINSLLSNEYAVYTIPGVKAEKVLQGFLGKITPDLFLLDCYMPGLSGFEIVPVLRNFAGHEDTPVIMMSSEKSEAILAQAKELGVNDFIVKPVDKDELIEKIQKYT